MKTLSLAFSNECQTFLCCPPREGQASLTHGTSGVKSEPRKANEPPSDSCRSE